MKNVIITGSSSGFGLLSAKTFADNGYKVWATMRNAGAKNAAVKEELESYSNNIKVVEMDVAKEDSVKQCIDAIIDEDGKVDVLINNAGIMYVGVTEAYSVEQAHQQMNINYYGIIRTSQAVLPTMRKTGKGLIINCTSTAGRVSWPFMGTYSASKFAVEGYTQALKYELAEMEPGKRPTRTQVGIAHGVDQINELTQPIQDNVLNELQLGFLSETKV